MFYKIGLDISNVKEMFEFLKNHFQYHTMNSWNGLKSIANNVKVYNLELDGDPYVALAALQKDDYYCVNSMIEDWEYEHPNYKVGFNGRSGGYLVLYNDKNNGNVLPTIIADAYDYEDFKQTCQEWYGGVKYFKQELKDYVELVRDFDKLCDDIRDYVNELSTIDFVKEYLEGVVEEFNESYYPDLHKWEANPLEVSEDNKIDIRGINESPALMKVLYLLFSDAGDYGYTVINEQNAYLKIEER